MAVGDGGILADGKDITEVMLGMLEKIKDDSTEVISIYYGSDVTEADAEAMKEKVVGIDLGTGSLGILLRNLDLGTLILRSDRIYQ